MRAREFIKTESQQVDEIAPILGLIARGAVAAGGGLARGATSLAGKAVQGIKSLTGKAVQGATQLGKQAVSTAVNTAAQTVGTNIANNLTGNTQNAQTTQPADQINPADMAKLSGKEIDTGIPDIGKIKIGTTTPQGTQISLSNPNVKTGQILGPKFIVPTK